MYCNRGVAVWRRRAARGGAAKARREAVLILSASDTARGVCLLAIEGVWRRYSMARRHDQY